MTERATEHELEFSGLYNDWFKRVVHWLRAFGVPSSELEDVAQEVFVVVRRKLVDFDGANLAGWLYRIAANTASDFRRRSWFRNLFSRAESIEGHDLVADRPTPIELLEHKQARRVLDRMLTQMSAKRRVAFVLFELEGYSSEEIAVLEQIPVGTVRTRVHHARQDFYKLVAEYQRAELS